MYTLFKFDCIERITDIIVVIAMIMNNKDTQIDIDLKPVKLVSGAASRQQWYLMGLSPPQDNMESGTQMVQAFVEGDL